MREADKACGGVPDCHPGDGTDVEGCVIGEYEATHGPVDDGHAFLVPAADGDSRLVRFAGVVEWDQVVGIMGEVGIHFEHIFILVFEGPLEACQIGGSESQFSGPLDQEEASRVVDLELFDDSGGMIGGMVVNDQDVELFGEAENGKQEWLDVFGFLVGGYDDEGIGHGMV